MSLDFCEIEIISGNGGDGAISFLREKYIPNGGPDGGNGGDGGSIIIKSNNNLNSLSHIENNKKIIAKNGENGSGNNKHGKDAENIILEVPVGTIVLDEKNNVLCDLNKNDYSFIIAKGGKGGKGNCYFKNSRIKSPKIAEKGYSGEHKKIFLQLKFIADIGLLGLPNAGKSTFLSVVTNAKPKIGNYPFTTISPNIGALKYNENKYLIADLPGIIENAHQGKGLGHIFLQHLKRCKAMIFLISVEDDDPFKSYEIIINELKKYNKTFLKKKIITVLSKNDLKNTENKKKYLENKIKKKIFSISSLTKDGINNLLQECIKILKTTKNKTIIEKNYIANENDSIFKIQKIKSNEWLIISEIILKKYLIKKQFSNNIFDNNKNISKLLSIMKKFSVIKQLKKLGAKENDIIHFGNITFSLNYHN